MQMVMDMMVSATPSNHPPTPSTDAINKASFPIHILEHEFLVYVLLDGINYAEIMENQNNNNNNDFFF